jgi:hypothetical protein
MNVYSKDVQELIAEINKHILTHSDSLWSYVRNLQDYTEKILDGTYLNVSNTSVLIWCDPGKELPREGNPAVLVYTEGKVMSATYDYYCPVISTERVSKWVIYRTPSQIVYLPGKVDLWAYMPVPK